MAVSVKTVDYAISTATVTYTVPTPTGTSTDVFTLTLQADGADLRVWHDETEADTGTDNYFTLRDGASLSLNFRYLSGTKLYLKRDASTDGRLETFYAEGMGT